LNLLGWLMGLEPTTTGITILLIQCFDVLMSFDLRYKK
jgi:hypothetical protein